MKSFFFIFKFVKKCYMATGALIPSNFKQFLMVILDLSTSSNRSSSLSAPITGTDL
jgi:hypothetical protein